MDELDGHTAFRFPNLLQTTELIDVTAWKGMTEKLKSFTKEKICDGFANRKTFFEVAAFVKNQLDEEDGGLWFCMIRPNKSVANSRFSFKNNKYLVLKFVRNNTDYRVIVAKTCRGNCKKT